MSFLKPLVRLVHLGRVPYTHAYAVQQNLLKKVKASSDSENNVLNENYVVIAEHDPVYTTGIRSKEYGSDTEQRLRSLNADFVRAKRGGLITYHGPGQLLVYPILNLLNFMPANIKSNARQKKLRLMGIKWYVHTLEQTVIDSLREDFGLKAHRHPLYPGVWVRHGHGEEKICAVGLHNSELVTSHGLALNCDVDLSWFDHIVPCGIVGKGVTSITKHLGRRVTVKEAETCLIKHFAANFYCDIEEYNNNCDSIQQRDSYSRA